MFAPRYFAPRYFAPRYFPVGADGTADCFNGYFAPSYFANRYFATGYFSPICDAVEPPVDCPSFSYFATSYFAPSYFATGYFSPSCDFTETPIDDEVVAGGGFIYKRDYRMFNKSEITKKIILEDDKIVLKVIMEFMERITNVVS